MKAIRHPETTRTLDPPPDFEHPCSSLPIVNTEYGMMSFWQPTWKDRVRILIGKPIRLCVAGSGHPPVFLDTEDM